MKKHKKLSLQQFIDKSAQENPNNSNNYTYYLARWSMEKPYWCIIVIIDEKTRYGYYCLGKNAKLKDVLPVLVENNCKVTIAKGYLLT